MGVVQVERQILQIETVVRVVGQAKADREEREILVGLRLQRETMVETPLVLRI